MYELLLKIFTPTSGRLISTMNLVSNYSDCALYDTIKYVPAIALKKPKHQSNPTMLFI